MLLCYQPMIKMGTSSIIIMLSSVITSYATHVDKLLSSIQDPFQLSMSDALPQLYCVPVDNVGQLWMH